MCSLLHLLVLLLVLRLESRASSLSQSFLRHRLPRSHSGDRLHPLANCSNCRHVLAARIKQQQTLHSLQKRIMDAINRTENDTPTPAARHASSSSSDTNTTGRSDAGPSQRSTGEAALQRRTAASTEQHVSSERVEGGRSHVSSSSSSSDRPTSSMAESGPDILSLSRIVSSGRRRNILQFTLNPTKPQLGEVEVVKAHLWLLLGDPQRPSESDKVTVTDRDHSNLKGTQVELQHRVNKNKGKVTGESDSEAIVTETARKAEVKVNNKGRHKPNSVGEVGDKVRSRRELDMAVPEDVSEEESEIDDGASVPHGRTDKRLNNKGKKSEASNDIEKKSERKSATENVQSEDNNKRARKFHKKTKQKNKEDGKTDRSIDKNTSSPDNKTNSHEKSRQSPGKVRKKAVLRVLLVGKDGSKRLLTYLRTSVRRRHWRKLVLPAGLVQEQLQQENPTLTLMLRCSQCGRSVRMLLPKTRKSKRRKAKKQTSRNGIRQFRAGRVERYSLRKARRLYSPSAFLVINTRIKPHSQGVM